MRLIMLRNHRPALFRFGTLALVAGVAIAGVRLTALRAQPAPISKQDACVHNLHQIWSAYSAYLKANGRPPASMGQLGLHLFCPADPDSDGVIASGAITCDYGFRSGVLLPGGGEIVSSPYPAGIQPSGPVPLVVCVNHLQTVPVTRGADGKFTGGERIGDYLILETDGTVRRTPLSAVRWVATKWLNPNETWKRRADGGFDPVPGTVKPSDAVLWQVPVFPGEPEYPYAAATGSEARAQAPIVFRWSPAVIGYHRATRFGRLERSAVPAS